jgi:two-component system NtrC family sensor kinase
MIPATASSTKSPPVEPSLPNVLVVDDVEANLVALDALLGDMRCNLVFARSGNEALRLLLRREFAVLLLDVQMPEMDGYEVARHAREHRATSDTPIIFVTATHNTEDNVLRGYGSGAVDFLFKPIDATVLRSKVRVFLDLYNGRRKIAAAASALELANAQLKQTQAQLVQSAKMASLGTLVAGIAHEINNPLSFTLNHLDTVSRSLEKVRAEAGAALADGPGSSWERAVNRLHEMGLGLERIRDLVLKLRTFSRLDEGESKRIDVRESIDSILTIFKHRMVDRVRVELDIGEPLQIECSPGLFNQALANLVSNALDVMPTAGTLGISARRDGDSYCMSVEDTGPGIPEPLRDRVLEPFFTTKPVGEGTGLGLSITYSIVKKHGGTISIGDASRGGARVQIRLPIGAAMERKA